MLASLKRIIDTVSDHTFVCVFNNYELYLLESKLKIVLCQDIHTTCFDISNTLEPRYNAVVGVQAMAPRYR